MKLVIVMYIYVDVLLILNLYVNYFLLLATGRLMHLPCGRKRCIAAAAVGSLCALTIFLPPHALGVVYPAAVCYGGAGGVDLLRAAHAAAGCGVLFCGEHGVRRGDAGGIPLAAASGNGV